MSEGNIMGIQDGRKANDSRAEDAMKWRNKQLPARVGVLQRHDNLSGAKLDRQSSLCRLNLVHLVLGLSAQRLLEPGGLVFFRVCCASR
jgi:hypothetical protein